MKSGTISRRELRERRPARPPSNQLPLIGALALGLLILVWFAGRFTINGETAVALPTPSSTPTPTPGPTPPPAGLIILSPADGAVVNVGGIVVEGLAAPGSPITWDRPLWFDDHTTADAHGYWSFVVGLNVGDNVLTFRVGDDV